MSGNSYTVPSHRFADRLLPILFIQLLSALLVHASVYLCVGGIATVIRRKCIRMEYWHQYEVSAQVHSNRKAGYLNPQLLSPSQVSSLSSLASRSTRASAGVSTTSRASAARLSMDRVVSQGALRAGPWATLLGRAPRAPVQQTPAAMGLSAHQQLAIRGPSSGNKPGTRVRTVCPHFPLSVLRPILLCRCACAF